MYQKKHNNSRIRSFRVSEQLDNFFKERFVKNRDSYLTANDFLIELVENSQEYKEYKEYQQKKAEQDNKRQPSLF